VSGKLLVNNDNWTETGETFYAFGSVPVCGSIHMIAGQRYEIIIDASSKIIPKGSLTEGDPVHVFVVQPSVRIGYVEELESDEKMVEDAVAAAKNADVVICVVGLNDEWESEGYDRRSMSLPGTQDALVYALLKKCKHKMVVVNQSGSAVHMPWADEVGTIVQALYGGQEAGNALWDVMMGTVAPSGRFTWPMEYQQLGFRPETFPGINGLVEYEETAIGYRWYQKEALIPRWWFGWDLGYTSFELSSFQVVQGLTGWGSKILVKNVGNVEGREVVQLYSSSSRMGRKKELRAFEKTRNLLPGEQEEVSMPISARDLAQWHGDEGGQWVTKAGVYVIWIGKYAGDDSMLLSELEILETLKGRP
jgi:beta-glucosidase